MKISHMVCALALVAGATLCLSSASNAAECSNSVSVGGVRPALELSELNDDFVRYVEPTATAIADPTMLYTHQVDAGAHYVEVLKQRLPNFEVSLAQLYEAMAEIDMMRCQESYFGGGEVLYAYVRGTNDHVWQIVGQHVTASGKLTVEWTLSAFPINTDLLAPGFILSR